LKGNPDSQDPLNLAIKLNESFPKGSNPAQMLLLNSAISLNSRISIERTPASNNHPISSSKNSVKAVLSKIPRSKNSSLNPTTKKAPKRQNSRRLKPLIDALNHFLKNQLPKYFLLPLWPSKFQNQIPTEKQALPLYYSRLPSKKSNRLKKQKKMMSLTKTRTLRKRTLKKT